MTKEQRAIEAQRIAEANEGTITFIEDDAEYFEIRHTVRGTINGIEADAIVSTHFEWNEFRFEGF
ncbi:MAG TPA: hypothetical protein VIM30_14820 [Candidatus Limnocylindrales bacterium]